MNLEMIRDEIEEIVYENGMSFFDDYEKIEINEERVEVYKVKDVYCVLFFDINETHIEYFSVFCECITNCCG